MNASESDKPLVHIVAANGGGVNVIIDNRGAAYFPQESVEQAAFLVENANRAHREKLTILSDARTTPRK